MADKITDDTDLPELSGEDEIAALHKICEQFDKFNLRTCMRSIAFLRDRYVTASLRKQRELKANP